jgi:solute:Na+ symporter, SSS family
MIFGSLHWLDIAVVVAYFAAVIYIGQRASKATKSEEGFFLAGRKLGKLYQFFLSFGNATEPQGAVSTASLVFQRGVAGVWFSFQTVFMNPYFWFMNVWFRRVRLMTVADLFEDRFDSRGLSRLYTLSQIAVACVFLGFANFVAYKIASSLVVKPAATWTAEERAAVHSYEEMKRLERAAPAGQLSVEETRQLGDLRDRYARGELHSYITLLKPLPFYLAFTIIVGAYIVLGGMSAAAVNEGLQSVLIIVFSILLIPTGLAAIGGWGEIAHKVPKDMMDLFAGQGTSPWFILAVLLPSLVQMHALSHNMTIFGSAKNEFAARFGVTGNYLKRFMIILWAFAGLIAIALFGVGGLADPDMTWGVMSNRLLGPGLAGLMLAGVLAGTMSTLAAKALAISSLFVRNFYRHIRPDATSESALKAARWTVIGVLALGVVSALLMSNLQAVVVLVLTVNVPFGAAVLMIFFWRRLTAPAVWAAVALSSLIILFIPLTADYVPALRQSDALTVTTNDAAGKPVAVYWKQLVRVDPTNPTSALEGRGRFNLECWLLDRVGFNTQRYTPNGRETAQFFVDGLLPFVFLVVFSYLTRPTEKARVDQFYGKMKTPIGDTPEAEEATMALTRQQPGRFDHTKLFGANSNWEFAKWDRVDAIGFAVCCAISGGIIALFAFLLKIASAQ